MADFGAPVAQNINVNPQQGIQTLSGLVGLQQQQQQLQQQQMATQAKATTLQEQRALQQINPANYMKNGVLDAASYGRDAIAATPFSGLGVERAQKALEVQNSQITVQRAAQGLNEDQRRDFTNGLETTAQKSDGNWADVDKFAQDYKKQNPGGAGVADAVMSTLNPKDPWQLNQQKIHSLNVALKGVGTPTTGSAYDANSNLVGTAQSPITGAITTAGNANRVSAPPTIVTPPGGNPALFRGGSAPSPGAAGGPAPTNEDWTNFGAYQSNLNQRVRVASDVIPRIQMAEGALDQIKAGAGADVRVQWARRLQAIGAPQTLVDAVGNGNVAAAQEAEKLLFQTTFAGLKQSMQGDPARVAEFDAAEKVFPTIGTDPRATKQILGFMVDQGQRDFAEQRELNSARKGGTFNPATWEGDYQAKLRSGQVKGVAPSQVPGQSAPAASAEKRSTSKSGKPIVFRNGRWEYE